MGVLASQEPPLATTFMAVQHSPTLRPTSICLGLALSATKQASPPKASAITAAADDGRGTRRVVLQAFQRPLNVLASRPVVLAATPALVAGPLHNRVPVYGISQRISPSCSISPPL
jgi:hypothetical protein